MRSSGQRIPLILNLGLALILVAGPLTGAQAATRSFNDALGEIIAKSTPIAIERATFLSIEARGVSTRLALLPTVSASVGAARTHQNSVNTDSRTAELQATLNIFKWGADYLAWQAAVSEESAAELKVQDAQIRAEAEGARALLTWISRSQQVGVLERTVEMQKRTLSISRERYSRGLLPEQEVEKLAIDAENAKSRLSDAVAAEAEARARARALADDPGLEIAREWPWKETLSKPNSLPSWTPEQTQARPDIRAAELTLLAQERRATQSWRTLLPQLDASWVYGTSETLGSGIGYRNYWTGQLTLNINLFDRWTGIGEARASARAREIAEYRLNQIRRDSRADIDSAAAQLSQALDSAKVRDRTGATSRRLFEDAQRRFQAGRSSANELSTEQSRLDEADLLAIRGWESAHLALTDLCVARGSRLLPCVSGAGSP